MTTTKTFIQKKEDVQNLALKVEHTARDLRAKNIEHKHLFEAAEYMRFGSIPIPMDSTSTYVNILRGTIELSDQNRRALCPDPHESHAPLVSVYVQHDHLDFDDEWNVVKINNQTIAWFSGYEDDDVEQSVVDTGVKVAKALGVGLAIYRNTYGLSAQQLAFGHVELPDDDGVDIRTISIVYKHDQLHDHVKEWKDVFNTALVKAVEDQIALHSSREQS